MRSYTDSIVAKSLGLVPASAPDLTRDKSFFLKQAFIEASQGIANELALPIDQIGVLFDKTIPTAHKLSEKPSSSDVEKAGRDDASSYLRSTPKDQPEGVMLVLVRQLGSEGPDNPERYLSKGFRMSETRFLVPVLSDHFGVDKALMEETLTQLLAYAKRCVPK